MLHQEYYVQKFRSLQVRMFQADWVIAVELFIEGEARPANKLLLVFFCLPWGWLTICSP